MRYRNDSGDTRFMTCAMAGGGGYAWKSVIYGDNIPGASLSFTVTRLGCHRLYICNGSEGGVTKG